MFLQVSKISPAGLLFLVLLFQQFNVGSEAYSAPISDNLIVFEDTINAPHTNLVIQADTIRNDSLITDTNVVSDEVLKSPVKYHARDSMRVNMEDETVYLFGAATVDYEDMHLDADYIVIDMNKKELFAEGVKDSTGITHGTPRFSQGEQKFKSSAIHYNFASKRGKIDYVITQEGQGYIHGEVVKKDAENNFFIRNGQYTTCDKDIPDFGICSNKLKVISNNKIVTGPAYLTIEGVPTPLLLPFGFFPNKKGRSSGLIFPSFGESTQRGFYFQNLGYYLGFSDYFTVALTSDLYTKGSYTFNGVSVYRKRYHYNGNLRLSYAHTINGDKEIKGYSTVEDFRINWIHSQDAKLNPNSTFSANVNAGTSSYYANTIASVGNFLSNTFQSSISYSHHFPDKPINLSIALNHSQNSLTRDIRITAPDVSLNVSRINPFKRTNPIGRQRWYEKIGTSYSFRGTNFIETKDSLFFRKNSTGRYTALDNFRNGFQHTIPFSTSFNVLKYFNISPSFNYTERWYFKTTQYSWNDERQKTDTFVVKKFLAARDYQVAAGMTTKLYGMYQFRRGRITAIRHVMTPSASLSFRPDFGKDSYGYYKNVQVDTNGRTVRYSVFQNSVYGGPGAGRYANLGFSLDNNLEMKVKTQTDTGAATKKVKILESLRISGGYNMFADSLKLSVITVTGRTTILDRININFGGALDPYEVDTANFDIDRFTASHGGPLARLTSANLSLNFSLNKSISKPEQYSQQEIDYFTRHPEEYVDFNIPFNLSVSYSYLYSKKGNDVSKVTQSSSFNGDLSVTPQWKIGFNSWYDITDGRFTNLGLNIYRDLHCWEMRLNWIPFGYQESWNFQINVKASILQDLKLKKQKEFYD